MDRHGKHVILGSGSPRRQELMKLLDSVSATTGTSSGAQMSQSAAANTITPITVRAAATIATMAPIIALYPFLQRYFVTGLTIGGVKE